MKLVWMKMSPLSPHYPASRHSLLCPHCRYHPILIFNVPFIPCCSSSPILSSAPPPASDIASDQGQVLVIVTAAVGGFTLLVILTLFLLITGR